MSDQALVADLLALAREFNLEHDVSCRDCGCRYATEPEGEGYGECVHCTSLNVVRDKDAVAS